MLLVPALPAVALAHGETAGSTAQPPIPPGYLPPAPESFSVSAADAVEIATEVPEVAEQSARRGRLATVVQSNDEGTWEVGFWSRRPSRWCRSWSTAERPDRGGLDRRPGRLDDGPRLRGRVRPQAERALGLDPALRRSSCSACSTWRRPWRIAHLDLLVMRLGFGSPTTSSTAARSASRCRSSTRCSSTCWRGCCGSASAEARGCARACPTRWLAIAVVFLLGFRVDAQHRRLGRDRRRLRGCDRRRPDHRRAASVRRGRLSRGQPLRRHLRSGQLLRLRALRAGPAVERASGTSSPAAHAAAIVFDLLDGRSACSVLGLRLRPGRSGRELGAVLAFGWARLSRTRPSRSQSNTNDALFAACWSWPWRVRRARSRAAPCSPSRR